jgi:TonB family protein
MKAILALAGVALALLACGSQPAGKPTASELPPKVESLVQPSYPEDARKAGIEGTAIVEVTVSADGTVLGCSLATSSGNVLMDAAAISAAKASKFAPGTRDGKPVVTKVRMPIRFKLADKQTGQRGQAQAVPSWAERHEPALPAMEV